MRIDTIKTRYAHRSRRGLSLIEVMVSLAITAALLVATAAAFDASASAVDVNDKFFRASQAARVCINQMMTEIRRCQSGAVSSTSLDLQLNTGENRSYVYDAASKQLQMVLRSIPVVETYPMAHNIDSMSFASNGKTISITISVKIGVNTIVLNGSATPRRVTTY